MNSLWLDQEINYDGSQLRSLFAYMECGLQGDSILGWQGPCEVTLEHMVDGEDRRANARICGFRMVHFIIEKFDCSLLAAVALQRLLAGMIKDVIQEMAPDEPRAKALRREGDDLFFENQKLSISIATVSPVSALIHFAVNVTQEGTPVPTLSLGDLKIDPVIFAKSILDRFTREVREIQGATQKVQWVR